MSVQETTLETASGGLLLDSLEIKNFRAFRHLTIEKLGRVNLITGKNNVGKTSLLEAVWIYAYRAAPSAFWQMFRIRHGLSNSTDMSPEELVPALIRTFHGVSVQEARRSQRPLTFRISDLRDISPLVVTITWFVTEQDPFSVGVRFGAINNSRSSIYSATRIIDSVERMLFDPVDRAMCSYVPATGVKYEDAAGLWDDIVLTPLEDVALDAARLIAPGLQKIQFRNEAVGSVRRAPYVQLEGSAEPTPLYNAGDGVNRLLGLVLSLLAARSGVLLADEIENGIHYSVLLQMWRTVFQLARLYRVQVFATTHSWDCIEAFQQAAAEDNDPNSGVLIRLQNADGNVTSTVFDERRLAVVTRQGIEVR